MLSLGIAGCSGDDGAQGPQGAQGPTGPTGATGPAGPSGTPAITLTPSTDPATFAALNLQASVQSVTITNKPVVKFKLTTTEGVPVIGFGSTSQTATAVAPSYPNLAFSIAKLVPASGGTPSKWVNYIVTTMPTYTSATDKTIIPAAPTRPSTDNTGTLVDNKDGTYTYTFYRDVTAVKSLVDASTDTSTNKKADLGDLTYVASATHRLTIQISGSAPGTGSNTANGATVTPAVNLAKPVDVIYDFVPSTGLPPAASANRKMVDNGNCESCHSTLGGLPGGDGASLDFHGGGRNNIEYCVICHTDQRRYGRTEATYNATTRAFSGSTYVVDGRTVGTAPSFIHKIHVGGVMTKTGYNYGGVLFDEGGYSQDIRNCEKCHNPANASTPQATQWKDNPNRVACGSCHDGINFDTGVGLTLADKAEGKTTSTDFFGAAHPANAVDGSCSNSSCHGVGSGGYPDLVHLPVTPPNKSNALQVDSSAGGNANTNAAWIASNTSRLPAGAIKVTWDVKSVSLNAARNPVMVFRWLQNGTAVPISTLAAATAAPNPATGLPEMWPNFMGAPSAYFVWSVPQDGNAAPVDFNASASVYLRSAWNGAAASSSTLTGPDSSGYYTVTITNVAVPASARMFTGGMGYSYNNKSTLPLTQTNLPAYPVTKSTLPASALTAGMPNAWGGLIVIAPNTKAPAAAGCVGSAYGCTSSGGFLARRAIVEDARCNACHQELGTFTEDAFHAGQRNDGTTCAWCHNPARTNQGWSVNAPNLMHGIHGAAKRSVPYTYDAISATEGFFDIVYPGVLARCEQCHVPGAYDFSNSASADAVGLGADQVDKRLDVTVGQGSYAATAAYQKSPYVSSSVNYGAGFSYNAVTGVTTEAAGTTLVLSPTVAICSGCHDTSLATSHFVSNGGSFYEPRSTAVGKVEQCFVCHSSGKLASIHDVHAR